MFSGNDKRYQDGRNDGFQEGWNACVDEIERAKAIAVWNQDAEVARNRYAVEVLDTMLRGRDIESGGYAALLTARSAIATYAHPAKAVEVTEEVQSAIDRTEEGREKLAEYHFGDGMEERYVSVSVKDWQTMRAALGRLSHDD
jgi:hypothetical protein